MKNIKLPSNLTVSQYAKLARTCARVLYLKNGNLNPVLSIEAFDALQNLQDQCLCEVAFWDANDIPSRPSSDLHWAWSANEAIGFNYGL